MAVALQSQRVSAPTSTALRLHTIRNNQPVLSRKQLSRSAGNVWLEERRRREHVQVAVVHRLDRVEEGRAVDGCLDLINNRSGKINVRGGKALGEKWGNDRGRVEGDAVGRLAV